MLQTVKDWLNKLYSQGEPYFHYVQSSGVCLVLAQSVLLLTWAECFTPKDVSVALIGVATTFAGLAGYTIKQGNKDNG